MKKQAIFSIAVVATLLVGVAPLVDSGLARAGLPDLLGKAQRPLPKGALQVDDLKSDPKGYTGSILVRGVIAKVSPFDPQSFSVIDSREARTCGSLTCAKFYLPIKFKNTNLKPWDEVNVRGVLTDSANIKTVSLVADSVENLGSIKK